MKYGIQFVRKVQTRDFESVTVGLTQEFDDTIMLREDAFKLVSGTVERWVTEKKAQYEAEQEKRQQMQYDKVRKLVEV